MTIELTERGIAATIDQVRGLPESTGKVGAVGFCLGGLLAFLTATRTAVVTVLGTLTSFDSSGNIEALERPVDVYWMAATVTLVGPAVGERWSLILDGTDFGFTPGAGATLITVASTLAGLANGAAAQFFG